MQTLVQASPEKVAEVRALRRRKAELEKRRVANLDAFQVLGYEPTCLPRHAIRKEVAERIGASGPYAPEVAAAVAGLLPEPCGQCPQERFHAATEDDILYGGAAGGGKTVAIVMEAVKAASKYPGIRVLMLRRSYDELAESLYPEFRRIGWAAALGGRWNKTEKEITFANGSLIRLRYLENLDDASRRQGGAYQLLCVDERTLLPPGVVDVVALERLRSAHGIPVLGVRSTSNPGGPSHGEVRDKYVDPTDHGAKVLTDEQGLTVRFIPAKATDNPYLDAAYHRRLASIKDPARRAAMQDGDWGQFSGQIFSEFRWDRHTLDPIPLPLQWTRYTGTDWGFRAPFANLWCAVDEDGRAYFYREIYQAEVGEGDQADMILAAEAEGERIAVRYADDAMWAARGDERHAKPIADIYAEHGVHLTKAGKFPGSRTQGYQRWHSYLAEAPACPQHRAQGWVTCPLVHIFRTCKKLLFELQNLPYATKGNPEDSDPKAPDHAMDGSRYILLNIDGGPKFPVLDDEEPGLLDGIPVMQQVGQFGFAPPSPDDPWRQAEDGSEREDGDGDDDTEGRGKTRQGFS